MLDIGERHLLLLDAEATDPAHGRPFVTLGLAIAQQDTYVKRVVEPNLR